LSETGAGCREAVRRKNRNSRGSNRTVGKGAMLRSIVLLSLVVKGTEEIKKKDLLTT
jgi:hypothetical protein